ncbi:hypothetical protein TRVL_02650 [Trypanosoma vivax]|nr:hypothetical protein TRVL_02650 [Trypanosoma vivax]
MAGALFPVARACRAAEKEAAQCSAVATGRYTGAQETRPSGGAAARQSATAEVRGSVPSATRERSRGCGHRSGNPPRARVNEGQRRKPQEDSARGHKPADLAAAPESCHARGAASTLRRFRASCASRRRGQCEQPSGHCTEGIHSAVAAGMLCENTDALPRGVACVRCDRAHARA